MLPNKKRKLNKNEDEKEEIEDENQAAENRRLLALQQLHQDRNNTSSNLEIGISANIVIIINYYNNYYYI